MIVFHEQKSALMRRISNTHLIWVYILSITVTHQQKFDFFSEVKVFLPPKKFGRK